MPTITQLPSAGAVSAADELPLSQGGVTVNVSVGNLLAGTQPAISAPTGSLLGRLSTGAGGPEPVSVGTGLAITAASLAATGADHAAFPAQPTLTLTDTLVLNSNGQPRQMQVAQLHGLFSAGANIAIDANGVISAPAQTASLASTPAVSTMAATDLVAISQGGANHAIQLGAMLNGTDASKSRATASAGLIGHALADHAARRLDPRDFAANMFSGATSQDDAAGIQAAINYAQSQGGGIIQLPSHGSLTGQLATPLTISHSGVCLIGQTRSILTHDNLGPVPDAAIKLRWVGPSGATMLRVAPPVNLTTGIPVSGADIRGILLDCAGIAAIGAAFASVQHSFVDLMVTEAVADGVLLDTVDIGEFNDCQNNEFWLSIRILTTTGNCLRLAGTARALKLGNSSYNQFRSVTLTHNAGDAIVFDYADSNWFDKTAIQNRPSFSTTLGTPGAGRSIVFKGSSEIVARATGNVALFGGNNNIFNQLTCAGPICSLGLQSGYTAPASQNRILRFDNGNGTLNLVTESGANIQVSTSDNTDLATAASQISIANSGPQAAKLRAERGAEAVAISSTTGDHVGLYAPDKRLWGYGVDGATNDLRFSAFDASAGQINLGNGQPAYALNAFGVGTRVPANAPPGVVYAVDTGTNTVPAPASGLALLVRNGVLNTLSPAGVTSPVAAPRRAVTTATDAPTVADSHGVITYTAATTVTLSDLGSQQSCQLIQAGTGTLTLQPAVGATMLVNGNASVKAVSSFQGALITILGTGAGTVLVNGNAQ